MVSPLSQAIAFQNSFNPAQSGIAPTDVVGSYKLASDVAEKNYAAKLAANNAMWGGLAGLGGAGMLAFGPAAAKSWFGQGASTVAPTATSAGAGATPGVGAALPGTIDASAPLAYSGLPAGFDAATIGAPTVVGDLGASAAAPTVAADLAAAAPEAAAGTDLLASIPEWLLPLLFAA